MTEAEARAALRTFAAVAEIEQWIAKQSWKAAAVEGEVKGLREALDEARRPFWRRWFGL